MFCAFSGGRDSVALALIARQVRPDVPLIWSNTGLGHPDLVDFVRDFGGDHLVEVRPEADPRETWAEYGCRPLGGKMSAAAYKREHGQDLGINPSRCCELNKAAPMNARLRADGCTALLFGARGDDSNRHMFKLIRGEIIHTDRGWPHAYPLLFWTADDSRAYLREHFPEYPVSYGRSEELGCRPCAVNLAHWPNGLANLRQSDPDLHRELITQHFGLAILRLRFGVTEKGARQLVARWGWPHLIDNGYLDRIPKANQKL